MLELLCTSYPSHDFDVDLSLDDFGNITEINGNFFTQQHDTPPDELSDNSTAISGRKPDRPELYARGHSGSMPFAFGGMDLEPKFAPAYGEMIENLNFSGTCPELEELIDDLKYIAPGLSRGLFMQENIVDWGPKADFSLDELLRSDIEDKIEQLDLEAFYNVKKQSSKINEEKREEESVDELLEKVPERMIVNAMPSINHTKKTWAHMVDSSLKIDSDQFKNYVGEMAKEFPFELDTFQKHAVIHLEKGECVFVAAHTSAGKTVVAEYAIALASKHMTRCIYTSPIKSLSNQKFRDFRLEFGEENVGLLTGDVQIRPEAPCVIMTTEILRSMLYRGADMIRDVEFVIFDEVHYINDAERGVVWEEVIIMLPEHVTIILLSATVPNTFEFANWVGRTKKRDIYVINTQKRPVPLEHYLFVSSVLPHKLFKIVDSSKNFLQEGYKNAWNSAHIVKESKEKATKPGSKVKTKTVASAGQSKSFYVKTDRNIWVHLVNLLKKNHNLPVIIFTFSKKKCEDFADTLSNIDLLNSNEKSDVHVFIERSLARLKKEDKDLPQILRMRSLLARGIGVHHSGLLPIVKELVEILFARNLIKVLFATETFAMGVNMPAKCVVFSGIRKHDGRDFRELLPGEYTQMSGRSGRRGIDITGMVILACSGSHDFPEAASLQSMILGLPTRLESQFRLTYNMILNLLRVEAFKVEDMMKRSFFEDGAQKEMPEQEKLLKDHEKMLKSTKNIECNICGSDIEELYQANLQATVLNRNRMDHLFNRTTAWPKFLPKGRVALIHTAQHRNQIAVVINPHKESDERTFDCYISMSEGEDNSEFGPSLPLVLLKPLMQGPTARLEKVSIRWKNFVYIFPHTIDPSLFEENSIEKNKPFILKNMSSIYNEIYDMLSQKLPPLEVDMSAKIKDLQFMKDTSLRNQLIAFMLNCKCVKCPDFEQHYTVVSEVNQLKETMLQLQNQLSDKNLYLLPDYNQRIHALRCMGYVENDAVQLKGRVACEINSSDSIILTELIMENVLNQLEPQEAVALLSTFIFQEKSEISSEEILPKLPVTLQEAAENVLEITRRVATVQYDSGLPISVDDFVKESLNFGLIEVVYEWACGTSFKKITEITDVLEGSIVRAMTRLDELSREVRDAARVIGNSNLYKLMEESSELIKRDIVFAASLYM